MFSSCDKLLRCLVRSLESCLLFIEQCPLGDPGFEFLYWEGAGRVGLWIINGIEKKNTRYIYTRYLVYFVYIYISTKNTMSERDILTFNIFGTPLVYVPVCTKYK